MEIFTLQLGYDLMRMAQWGLRVPPLIALVEVRGKHGSIWHNFYDVYIFKHPQLPQQEWSASLLRHSTLQTDQDSTFEASEAPQETRNTST
jgi:hypothetical protein